MWASPFQVLLYNLRGWLVRSRQRRRVGDPGFLSFELSEAQIRAMARGDRDFVLQATGDGQVSAVCKLCARALELAEKDGLVWFHCPGCDGLSFCPVANVQRDIEFARRDGQPFVSELFYMRQLPAVLKSPFVEGAGPGHHPGDK